jgi:hypothetical protein
MIRRLAITAAIPAVALLTALSATTPAAAITGGCTGSGCTIDLSKFIFISGNGGSQTPTGYSNIPVEPPPCLWTPIGDQTTGSQYIVNFSGGQDPGPGGLYGTGASFKQAKSLLAKPQPGEWYELPINPAASPAAQAECLKLPLFYFVPPGGAPPMPPIPGRILAEYAFAHLRLTKLHLRLNPAVKGYVNLATYVWNDAQQVPQPLTSIATLGQTGETGSVTATPNPMTISVSGSGTPYSACGPGGSSLRPMGTVPSGRSGPGQAPDCGVLWTGPSTGAVVTATIVWNIHFASYDNTVPPDTTIKTSFSSRPIPINEIQSINGG